MREIKFRQFIEGRFSYFGFNRREGSRHHNFTCPQQLNLERHPIDQFTGLKDKNGNDVYESDIIKSVARANDHNQKGAITIGRVYFGGGSFCIAPDNFETGTKLFDVLLINSVEIIGNIHETPELLK